MHQLKLNIADTIINRITYDELLALTLSKITNNEKTTFTYANANTINMLYKNKSLAGLLNEFDVTHPDGIGIFLASKFLFGEKGLQERISGSDFYPELAHQAIKNNFKTFFFGHDNETLSKIASNCPGLNICGLSEGYSYIDEEVISKINFAKPDILIIGLSQPKQEEWISKYKEMLNFKVCFCVGDGIKVFAGSKFRGPGFIQSIGLEWLARLAAHPFKYFRRYVIGNPLFLYRIIILKMRKFTQ